MRWVVWMSHFTHTCDKCHTCVWPPWIARQKFCCLWTWQNRHAMRLWVRMSHFTHSCDICHTYVWPLWIARQEFCCLWNLAKSTCDEVISHVTHKCEMWLIHLSWQKRSHICVTWRNHMSWHMNESCYTYVWPLLPWHKNESFHTCESVTMRIWTSHVTHMSEMCHVYLWLLRHAHICHTYVWYVSHICVICVTYMWHMCDCFDMQWGYESYHIHMYIYVVMSHVWMSHGTLMNESCHTHVWYMFDICVTASTCNEVMSHVTHMCIYMYIYLVMSHVWMSHVTHTKESCHVTHMIESCHSYVWPLLPWHMNVSLHTYESATCHICTSHVTHVNESCHTYEWIMSHIWMSHVTHMCDHFCHDIWMSHFRHMNQPR